MAKLQTTPTELTAAAAVEVMYALHLAVETSCSHTFAL